jgi:hypothetical protein
MPKPILIEFISGPGAGKTTAASLLWTILKQRGVHVEFQREVATQFLLNNRADVLSNSPLLLLATAMDQLDLLVKKHKFDVVVTDTSLNLGPFYAQNSPYLKHLKGITDLFLSGFDVITIEVLRNPDRVYIPKGRVQSFDEAKQIDQLCYDFLVPDFTVIGKQQGSDYLKPVVDLVLSKIKDQTDAI